MKNKIILGAALASAGLTAIIGGESFAATGNVATISGGATREICVSTNAAYNGSNFTIDLLQGNNLYAQMAIDSINDEYCGQVIVAEGDYSVRLNTPIGIKDVAYNVSENNVNFSADLSTASSDYLSTYGHVLQENEATATLVTFNVNGGTGSMDGQLIAINDPTALSANLFVRSGYMFTGWNTKADGSGIHYTNEQVVTLVSTEPLELFAQWTNVARLQTGKNVNQAIKRLVGDGTETYSTNDRSVNNVSFVTALPGAINANTADKVNVALENDMPIYAYKDSSNNIYIHTDAVKMVANEDMSYIFSDFKTLQTITFNPILDTTDTLDMSHMFDDSWNMTSINFSTGFNTSRVTNMSYMFSGLQAMTSLTLPNTFNTQAVKNMEAMFYLANHITSLSLPSVFNTSNVTNMSWMFSSAEALKTLNLPSAFDTSKVTTMKSMFGTTSSLNSLTLPAAFDTSRVTNMSYMFYMTGLTSVVLQRTTFDTSSATDMSYMFYGSNFSSLPSFISTFNTSRVTNMSHMFADMVNVTGTASLPNSFDTSNVEDMSSMFEDLSVTSLTLPSSFNTSKVTDMNSMFEFMTELKTISFPATFDTSRVVDMHDMFCYTALNSFAFMSSFDTSNVTNMSGMFSHYRGSLTTISLPLFDTSHVTDMSEMFWDMNGTVRTITLPDGFSTASVTNMDRMFGANEYLTTLNLPNSFVINSGATANNIFEDIKTTAKLYATDATARSLWPGVLGS